MPGLKEARECLSFGPAQNILNEEEFPYLLKLGINQNPKPAKMSQNQPKQPKMISESYERPETFQNFKIGEISNFLLAFKFGIGFQKFWSQMAKSGYFGPKSINVLILTKFRMCTTLNVLISNLTFVFKNFEHKFPNCSIKKSQILWSIFFFFFEGAYCANMTLKELWNCNIKLFLFWPPK